MSFGSDRKCQTKEGYCPMPPMWDTIFCMNHMSEKYLVPLHKSEQPADLVDH